MPGGRDRMPSSHPEGRTAPGRRRATTPAAAVLALQRKAGNQALGRVLARDKDDKKPTPDAQGTAPTFRLLLADDGKTGLSDAMVNTAVDHVKAELLRVMETSSDAAVKPGFEVQHVKQAPVRNDDFTHDLGRRTFLIFLTRTKDAKHAVELVWRYIPMPKDEREAREKHFKAHVASEGGVDMQTAETRRRTSQSVGFVGSDGPLHELKKHGGGEPSAAAMLADLILHELGHALGHNKLLGPMDHDETGIMTAQLVTGAEAYEPRKFSSASAKVVRDRLEELAKKLTPKRP